MTRALLFTVSLGLCAAAGLRAAGRWRTKVLAVDNGESCPLICPCRAHTDDQAVTP